MTSVKPKRPARRRAHDRITQGPASREEQMAHMAVAPFDRAHRVMDEKWGIDRLPELVDPVKAQRWGEVMAELNDAIDASDPQRTTAAVETALKGLAVMDATAEAMGHDPKPPALIEANVEGFLFGVMVDDRRWPSYQDEAKARGLTLFTLREVGLALAAAGASNPVVAEAKKQFPAAQISAIRPRTPLEVELDDEIPF
jgi:hypothetical protein